MRLAFHPALFVALASFLMSLFEFVLLAFVATLRSGLRPATTPAVATTQTGDDADQQNAAYDTARYRQRFIVD